MVNLDELNLIPFVGELRAEVLRKNGIKDIESLLKTSIERLASFEGFSVRLAQKIRNYASEIASMGLVGKEPIKELVFREFHCPKCGAIVSAVEPICHRCENIFFVAPENVEEMIGSIIIEILRDSDNSQLWKKLARTLESVGLHNEAVVCMFKVDLIEMFGDKEIAKKEKKIEMKGFVNGNGIVSKGGTIGSFHQILKAKPRTGILITVLTLLILPLLILSSSLAVRGIEIDGRFEDWKNIEGMNIYSEGGLIDRVKYYSVDATYIYIKLNTKLFVSPEKYYYTVLAVFLDVDLDTTTGYLVNGIGADRIILVFGYESKIVRSVSMEYNGNGTSWEWKKILKIRAACDDDEIEIATPKLNKFYSFILYKNIYNEYISSIFSTESGVFCIIEDDGKNIVYSNEEVCVIRIYPISLGSTQVRINLINLGNSTSAIFNVLDEGGNVLSRGIQPVDLNLDKPRKLSVVYVGNGVTSQSVYFSVNIEGTEAYVKNYAKGKYIEGLPSIPKLDGIFSDVIYHRDGEDCKNKDVDIIGGGIKKFDNRTLISFGVFGNLLRGSYIPISLFMDSDRDTLPDPIDNYPYDFNNDGIPDSKSKTPGGLPDIDKDGVADYPYGEDVWLNTTVDGKLVSIRLGTDKKVVGKALIHIYLEKSLIVMEGFNEKIINSTFNLSKIRHNSKYMEIEVDTPSSSASIFVKIGEFFDNFHIFEKGSDKGSEEKYTEPSESVKSAQLIPKYIGKFSSPIVRFGSDVVIDSASYDSLRPSITQTSDGKLWVAYESYDGNYYKIYFAISTDNGKSWSIHYFMEKNFVDHCYPVIARDTSNRVYIFFENRTSSSYFEFLRLEAGNVWYLYTVSAWNWWNRVRNISVWIHGEVVWLSLEYIYSADDYDVYAIQGYSVYWRRIVLASEYTMEKHPSVTVSSSRAVVAYQELSGDWNIKVKYSDGVAGYNFSSSNLVSTYQDETNAWLCSAGNYVWITWESLYSGDDTDIKYALSTDGGVNFGPSRQFSYSADNEKYPVISSREDNPNHIIIVYLNLSTSPKKICAAESYDGGNTWKIHLVNDIGSALIPKDIYRFLHVSYGQYGGYKYFYVVWMAEYSSIDRDIVFDRHPVGEYIGWYIVLIVTIFLWGYCKVKRISV